MTPSEIHARIAEIEEYYGGADAVDEALKQQGMSRDFLDQYVKEQLLGDKVYDQVVAVATVSDKAARAYYEKNKSSYVTPETRTTRHILVKTRAEAEQVRLLLVADPSDANWKKVARTYSTDPGSKDSGGSLGEVQPGDMVPNFDKATFALKLKAISKPVKTTYGYHIIQVTKIVKGSTKSFKDAKAEITSQLLSSKQQNLWEKWLKVATANAAVVYAEGYDPRVLEKTKPETASPSPSASPSASPSPSASKSASPSPSAGPTE